MKKLLSILFAIVAVFTLTFGLAACGEDEDDDDDDTTVETPKDDDGDDGDTEEATFWGTYYFYSVTYNGETYNLGDTFQNITLTKNYIVFIINEDGTFTEEMSRDGETVYASISGTWTGSGTSYVLTVDASPATATWDGDKTIVLSGEEGTTVITSQKD